MKKSSKFNTLISILIIVLLFGIALVVVIAGYNFIQGFTIPGAEEDFIKNYISALKGLSAISLGIFILLLVGLLVIDNSSRDRKECMQKGFEALLNAQLKIFESQENLNNFFEKKMKMSAFMEENELLRQEISAKNDNIKSLLYKIEALEEENKSFEDTVCILQKEVKKISRKDF